MFKKIIFSITIFVFLFSALTIAKAQFEWLPNAGISPDSKFYFLDQWGEKIGMFFTFSKEKKIEKAFRYAEERLAEAKKMVDKGKTEAYQKAFQNYEKHMNQTQERLQQMEEKGEKIAQVSEKVANATFKHFEVLKNISKNAPEQAQKGLQKALEVSGKGHKQALEALAKEKPQKAVSIVSDKIDERLSQIKEKTRKGQIEGITREVKNYKQYLNFGNSFVNELNDEMEKTVKGAGEEAKEKIREKIRKHRQDIQKMARQSTGPVRQQLREAFMGNHNDSEENSDDSDKNTNNPTQKKSSENKMDCIQVITPAKNPQTGMCKNFSTPCNVPNGWVKVEECDDNSSVKAMPGPQNPQKIQSR